MPDPGYRQQPRFLWLNTLRTDVMQLLGQVDGANIDYVPPFDNYRPHISLMQHAELSPRVFESAITFASAVIKDLGIPEETQAWQLVLIRFESDSTGEDWSHGGWAVDLRWNLLASYSIQI